MGEVMAVEEEIGPTSSGSANQGEMQGIKTASGSTSTISL